ncbi:uncharacterized protein LOC142102468 isoform X2 [Mixophyes fleayi]|uniref:uncharacterized protein LOC142102468 isoform X2 n=1 Tax=Mixophyes fleayi TaxID=3061075 RepID=UPI003F4E270B
MSTVYIWVTLLCVGVSEEKRGDPEVPPPGRLNNRIQPWCNLGKYICSSVESAEEKLEDNEEFSIQVSDNEEIFTVRGQSPEIVNGVICRCQRDAQNSMAAVPSTNPGVSEEKRGDPEVRPPGRLNNPVTFTARKDYNNRIQRRNLGKCICSSVESAEEKLEDNEEFSIQVSNNEEIFTVRGQSPEIVNGVICRCQRDAQTLMAAVPSTNPDAKVPVQALLNIQNILNKRERDNTRTKRGKNSKEKKDGKEKTSTTDREDSSERGECKKSNRNPEKCENPNDTGNRNNVITPRTTTENRINNVITPRTTTENRIPRTDLTLVIVPSIVVITLILLTLVFLLWIWRTKYRHKRRSADPARGDSTVVFQPKTNVTTIYVTANDPGVTGEPPDNAKHQHLYQEISDVPLDSAKTHPGTTYSTVGLPYHSEQDVSQGQHPADGQYSLLGSPAQ